jgi:hypothetical protein
MRCSWPPANIRMIEIEGVTVAFEPVNDAPRLASKYLRGYDIHVVIQR